MSRAFAGEHTYVKDWVRRYVEAYQLNILKSATLPGVLGPSSVMAGQAQFGDLQDIVQDGKIDGGRLIGTLGGCDAPILKTLVANAGRVRTDFPSSFDVYVPTMPTPSDLQSLAGQYSVRGSASVTEVTVTAKGSDLTLTDSRGRSFALQPAGDSLFTIAGTSEGRVTFHPVRQSLSFRHGKEAFIATRVDARTEAPAAAAPYEHLAGEYRVATVPARNTSATANAARGTSVTVAVIDGHLTLTDSQGRTHQLQATGVEQFVLAGAPQAAIQFVVYGEVHNRILLRYREGRASFTATRELRARPPRR